jgi:hypothetical protein
MPYASMFNWLHVNLDACTQSCLVPWCVVTMFQIWDSLEHVASLCNFDQIWLNSGSFVPLPIEPKWVCKELAQPCSIELSLPFQQSEQGWLCIILNLELFGFQVKLTNMSIYGLVNVSVCCIREKSLTTSLTQLTWSKRNQTCCWVLIYQ